MTTTRQPIVNSSLSQVAEIRTDPPGWRRPTQLVASTYRRRHTFNWHSRRVQPAGLAVVDTPGLGWRNGPLPSMRSDDDESSPQKVRDQGHSVTKWKKKHIEGDWVAAELCNLSIECSASNKFLIPRFAVFYCRKRSAMASIELVHSGSMQSSSIFITPNIVAKFRHGRSQRDPTVKCKRGIWKIR